MAFDPEKLSQAIIRHEVAARELDAGEADKIVRLLNATIADLNEKLIGRYAVAQAKGVDRGPATTHRLEEMMEGFEAINAKVYKKIGERVEGQLIDRAQHEMVFARDAAKSAGAAVTSGTRLPDTNYLRQLVRNTPLPIDEHTATLLQPWLKDMEANNLKRMGEILRVGFAQGATPAELAKTLQDRGYAKSRNSAQALALTANSAVANQARLETFRKMAGITHVEWSSVLDKSTTPTCQNLSGKIFPIDSPHPTPPRHIRCRSLLLPRKNDTDPPLHKPYSEWLKGQSADVQDEILGKERGRQYREGGITGDDLYAPSGRFRTLEELRRGDAKITAAPVAPAAPAKPKPFSPINENVTAASIKVEPKRVSTKALSETLARNAADPRYDPYPEFRGIKATDFGKAALGSLSNDASSMVRALMPELDSIADTFGVPRLRAVKTTGKAIASMGDGTLHVNPIYFDGYAAELASGGDDLTATLVTRRDKLLSDYKAMNDRLRDQRNALAGLTGVEREKAMHAYLDGVDELSSVRKEYEKVRKQVEKSSRTDASAKISDATTWKPGDDVSKRPRVCSDYFGKPIERARATLYHELFHHVHQMTGKKGRRALQKLPVEQEIKQLFFNKFNGAAPGNLQGRGLERKKLIATSYGASDPFEWACENFALYCMGRFDLVEDEMKELIERLIKEAKQ